MMSLLLDTLADTLAKMPIVMVLLAAVIAVTTVLQVVLGYTKPSIGYQVRSHRDRDHTFFVRNLDAVHYRQPMHVIVSGVGLESVRTRAGPWSQRTPKKIKKIDDRAFWRVVFDEMPEDAAFAIHAHCSGDARPTIEIAKNSPLQSRMFRKPLARFTVWLKLRYYGLRYVIGFLGFLVIFWGGVSRNHQRFEDADWVTVGVAAIVGLLSFALVVPVGGKRTIVGYLTPLEANQASVDDSGSNERPSAID